jgi:hypothetical protein
MRSVWLKAGGGIGIRILGAVELETIEGSRACRYFSGEITGSLSIQRMTFALNHHLQPLCLRRPYPKMRSAID